MAEKVLMLALSPTMEAGTIARWTKKEGDSVSNGDVLCEVETDKATMEYESIQEGTLLKIVVPEGRQAKVEQTIAIIGAAGEDFSPLLAEVDTVASGSGATASAGTSGAAASAAPARPTAEAAAGTPATGDGRAKSSPLARKLADAAGIDLAAVAGSGPLGRVVKRDIEQAIAAGGRPAGPARAGAPKTGVPAPGASLPAVAAAGADETVPVSQKRQIIARRLAESKYSAPHFYLKTSVFTETMMEARAALNATIDHKVSVNAFLMKFVAEALKRHPEVNSSWQGETILRFGSIDIALAVAQPDGLITPIVRNCGGKGIVEIDRELSDLIARARTNKLAPEEYTGATFSISSLGTFGIEEFTAIINPPGSAILAVGQMQKVPVVDEHDAVVVRSQMKLTLSCDHRVIDGAVGASFLSELKAMIEHPVRALY
jgi:pyruvate dehydrogenase E2 component (dihydrolipoamide acetyltransferase)